MWYVIIGAIIIWALCRYNKKKKSQPAISASIQFDNSGWEEAKKQKAKSLTKLKKSFQPATDNDAALSQASLTLNAFHENHGQSPSNVKGAVESIKLQDEVEKKEAVLRKELNKYYKNRQDLKSKAIAIQLAFEHAKLLLQNPDIEWKNFAGIQKLQSNWKSEEYFNDLLVLMNAFKNTFPKSPNSEKLRSDIECMFELWNSQNIARQNYNDQLKAYETAQSDSNRHFIILGIIEYLERRYKFNPRYKNELIKWCLKDIEIYEGFLKEFHEHQLFTIGQQLKFIDTPSLKQKMLAEISFERVKKLKDYIVPRLNSYDVLDGIYTQDKNEERLQWLKNIGFHIGYVKAVSVPEEIKTEAFDLKAITREIELPKSGQKGKLGFLNSNGESCSTEEAFKDDAEQKGWGVMRAEVSFWQAMFCISFWDEIFDGMGTPSQVYDIPHDLFRGEAFYLNRKQSIDSKYERLKQSNLSEFINAQISVADGAWTRLIYNGDQDMIAYSTSAVVQEFLDRITPETFAKIVYRIAQNPNENRSGVSDFVIWNDKELKMIEVKKGREQVRESQKSWHSWMVQEGIPTEIVRVKAANPVPQPAASVQEEKK